MYDNLIWELATLNAQPLVVFMMLTLILIWIRSILFSNKD